MKTLLPCCLCVDEALARGEQRYVLERVARYSDLSGWHWLLYRKQQP